MRRQVKFSFNFHYYAFTSTTDYALNLRKHGHVRSVIFSFWAQ